MKERPAGGGLLSRARTNFVDCFLARALCAEGYDVHFSRGAGAPVWGGGRSRLAAERLTRVTGCLQSTAGIWLEFW